MKLYCLKNKILKNNINYSLFCIKSLNSGFGLTLGNILRRILLSSILGTAITSIKINSLELVSFKINGLIEDFFELSLNIKKIILKSNLIKQTKIINTFKGPKVVTAADLILPNYIEVINPQQYLFTITDNIELTLEFIIENGFGYKLADEAINDLMFPNFKAIDTSFSPIIKFNYKIILEEENKNNNLKETLFFEIWTNGSITSKRALAEACKILIKIFLNILSNILIK